jgi:hypothetical protein
MTALLGTQSHGCVLCQASRPKAASAPAGALER